MNKIICLSLILVFAFALITAGLMNQIQTADAKLNKSDRKARQQIIKKLGQAVEGDWTSICAGLYSTEINHSNFVTFYNKTGCFLIPLPPIPPTPVCNSNQSAINGTCVDNPPIPPMNETKECPIGTIFMNDTNDCRQPPNPQPVENGTVIIDNGTRVCGENETLNITSDECLPNVNGTIPPVPPIPPEPPKPPQPETTFTKLILMGDFKPCSNGKDAIMKEDPTLFVALGDMGYGDTLDCFMKTWDPLKNDGKFQCNIGNHDTSEDAPSSSSPIIKQADAYCGQYWSRKINDNSLVIGFNTNADPNKVIAAQTGQLKDTEFMKGIKNVYITSHKPCYINSDPHHAVESGNKKVCDALAAAVPKGVNVFYIAGHEHNVQLSPDGHKMIDGAGGTKEYACGSGWWCKSGILAYLLVKIDDKSGSSQFTFKDFKGNVLKS